MKKDLTTLLSLLKGYLPEGKKANKEIAKELGEGESTIIKIFTKGNSKHKYIDTLNKLLLYLQDSADIEVFIKREEIKEDYTRHRFMMLYDLLFDNQIRLQGIRDYQKEAFNEKEQELEALYESIAQMLEESPYFFRRSFDDDDLIPTQEELKVMYEDEEKAVSSIKDQLALRMQFVRDNEKTLVGTALEHLIQESKDEIIKLKAKL